MSPTASALLRVQSPENRGLKFGEKNTRKEERESLEFFINSFNFYISCLIGI